MTKVSKIRFGISILLFSFIIFIFPLEILRLIDDVIFFLIAITLLASFYFVKYFEKRKLIAISKIYLDTCDPVKYVEEYQKYLKQIVTKEKYKYLHSITIALAHISAGKIIEAKQTLDELVEKEPHFDSIIRFWYYKAWIYYFEETKEIAKFKVLMHELKKLVDQCPYKFREQLLSNYNNIVARYYVLNNIHLDIAYKEFSKVFFGRYPKLNAVINVYYLGVIAYLENNYNEAKEYFNSVIRNGNKLEVVNKAKKYLSLINEDINSN